MPGQVELHLSGKTRMSIPRPARGRLRLGIGPREFTLPSRRKSEAGIPKQRGR